MIFIEKYTMEHYTKLDVRPLRWPKTYIVKNYRGDLSYKFVKTNSLVAIKNIETWLMNPLPRKVSFWLVDPE